MAEIVRRRSWGGVLPLGRHVSISGSRSIHAPSVSIAPSSFQEEQNARHHKQFKLEQALGKGNTLYGYRSAICLEPQQYPDAPNHPNFPSTVLKRGEWHGGRIVYRFSTRGS